MKVGYIIIFILLYVYIYLYSQYLYFTIILNKYIVYKIKRNNLHYINNTNDL